MVRQLIAFVVAVKTVLGSVNTDTMNQQESWGGGQINEVERQQVKAASPSGFDPLSSRSHLMHSIEGLHRYPNYLSRWNLEDIDKLESALQSQVRFVQEQRQAIQTRRSEHVTTIQKLQAQKRFNRLLTPPTRWEEVFESILDKNCAKAILGSTQWNKQAPPSVEDVLSGNANVDLDVARLTILMDEELPEIFAFPLLSREFCAKVCEYVKAFKLDRSLKLRTTNLDEVGLSWLNDLIFYLIMKPMSKHLFGNLDWRHGFVAGYSATPSENTSRQFLVTHTDDSLATLNVCLGENFEGGLLEFRGIRGRSDQTDVIGTYQPEIGKAVLHSGRHFHDVTPITAGNRFVLVMWARSWKETRAKQCPCCWLNNHDGPCVAGPRWN